MGNFVKSSLPRLLSKPAQDALKMLNVDFMDKKTGDMRNVVDIYADVAEKVQHISRSEKAVVMEGLAGKFHISRMTAFLDNFGMFEKMLNDSRNSMGSATKENDTYMQSIQARIKLMQQSMEKLALQFGEAFLTEGFIQTLKGLESVGEGLTGLVKTVGGLPLIFGTATTAIALMSKTFRGLLIEGTLLDGLFKKMAISATGMGLAIRTAIAATGVGLAVVGVSMGIEFLLRKTGEARQQAEELATKNKQLAQTFKDNKKDIEEVASAYEKYDKLIRSGELGVDYNTEDLAEYKRLSNELANLMPDLVVGEDQYGNKLVGSNEKIKAKIELLERQLRAQEKIDALEKKDSTEEAYDTSIENLKKVQKEFDNILVGSSKSLRLEDMDDAYERFSKLQDKMASGEKLSFIEKENFDYLKDLIGEFESLESELESAKLSYQKAIMDMIDVNVKLDESTSNTTRAMIDDFTTFVATTGASESNISNVLGNVLNAVQNDNAFKSTLEGYSKAIADYQNSINEGLDESKIEEYKQVATEAFEEVRNSLLKFAKGELKAEDLNAIAAQLGSVGNTALLASVDIEKLAETTGKSKEEIMTSLTLTADLADQQMELGDSANSAADGIDNLSNALERNLSTTEILLGVTSDQITKMERAVQIVQTLSTVENLNANQKALLAQATSFLSGMYPHLNGAIAENIGYIEGEIEAMNILNGASGKNADVLMNNQIAITDTAISAINNRIKSYKKEIDALLAVAQAQSAVADMNGEGTLQVPSGLSYLSQRLNGLYATRDALSRRKASYGSWTNPDTGSGGSSGGSSGSSGGSSSSSKDLPAAYEATFAKNEKMLRQIESHIKIYEATESQHEKGSKEYTNNLKSQINLMVSKRKILQDELNYIQKQLSSNKKLTKEQKAQLQERFLDIRDQFWGVYEEIQNLNDAINQNKIDGVVNKAADSMDNLNDSMQRNETALDRYTVGSTAWNKVMAEQLKLVQSKQKVNQEELNGLRKLLSSDKLSAEQKKEVQERIEDLTNAQQELINVTIDLNEQVAQSKIDKVFNKAADSMDNLNDSTRMSELMLARYKVGSSKWTAEINKQINLSKAKQKVNQQELASLKKILATEKLSADQKKEIQERIEDLTIAQQEQLNIAADLYQERREAEVAKRTEEINKIYDKQRDSIQKKLDMLDEEEKKTERIKRLNELNAEIEKTKSDKRFEYITKEGKVQLTYDKERVAELEKQKKELEEQYKKEDERAKLEKAIEDLESKREKAIDDLAKVSEDYLNKSFKSIDDLTKSMSSFIKSIDSIFNSAKDLPEYHTGTDLGGVGGKTSKLGKIIHRLIGAKPNEQVALLKHGEVVINPALPHVQSNMQNLLNGITKPNLQQAVMQNQYHFHGMTIKANNTDELFAGINALIRSE